MANQLKVQEQETIIHLAGMGWGIRRIGERGGSRKQGGFFHAEVITRAVLPAGAVWAELAS
jgi:hypothetical protein